MTNKRIHKLCQPLLKKAKFAIESCTQHATKGHEALVEELEELVGGQDQTVVIEHFMKMHPEYRITDGDIYGRTILHEAIESSVPQMVTYIVEHWGKQLVNRCDARGRSPLEYLLTNEIVPQTPELVRLLLESGARPNLLNDAGNTVLEEFVSKQLKEAYYDTEVEKTFDGDVKRIIEILREFGAVLRE